MIVLFEKSEGLDVYRAVDMFGNVYYGRAQEAWVQSALGEPASESYWQTSKGNIVEGRVLEALRLAHALFLNKDGDSQGSSLSNCF
jgi:hypothetical protein